MTVAIWRGQTQEDRFWGKVVRTESCWPRTGRRNDAGYRLLQWGGTTEYAHRVSWEIHFGPIPAGMHVCHSCPGGANPACVRPDHLFLGTTRERMLECVRQGRHGSRTHPERVARGDRSGARLHPERVARGDRSSARLHPERMARGERSGAAKLTEAQVLEAFRLRKQGVPQVDIANLLSISQSNLSGILRRNIWKHVEVPVELVS